MAGPVAVTITYFYNTTPLDVDNIPKPILDGLKGMVYQDDDQVFDMLCRKRDLNDSALTDSGPFPSVTGSSAPTQPVSPHYGGIRTQAGGGILIDAVSTAERQKLFIEKTAAEYRSRGYEVTQESPLEFLPDFRADLIVRKDGEAKVIEVKTRSSLAQSARTEKLARVLQQKPGWSLEILLVGEPDKLEAPLGAQSLGEREIHQKLTEAEEELKSNKVEAAFLLAWSACEATVRSLLAQEGVVNEGIATTGLVLDQAVFHGVISRDEYNTLTSMRKYRNAITHGFSFAEFRDERVMELIHTVRLLAISISQPGENS